jgi:hypothetical protein
MWDISGGMCGGFIIVMFKDIGIVVSMVAGAKSGELL